MSEIWKDIPGFKGFYKVSNIGRVKSLKRIISNQHNSFIFSQRILINKMSDGYHCVRLCKEGVEKTFKIHRLVMLAFVGPSDLPIDHRNEIKTDNRLENLRYCTDRQNITWSKLNRKKTSQFTGVSWFIKTKKWRAQIRDANGRKIAIGYFHKEDDARNAYCKKANELGIPII